jgi:hypothetical protein
MPDLTLSQAEADALIAMEKHRINEDPHNYPGLGGSICVPLTSTDKRESFLLDVSRGRIDLRKGTYQTRARQIVVLVRLDFGGPPHRNPDGAEIASPHLHIYREGYGDKWATPIPSSSFPRINEIGNTLDDFMTFCNVTLPPNIVRGLF